MSTDWVLFLKLASIGLSLGLSTGVLCLTVRGFAVRFERSMKSALSIR